MDDERPATAGKRRGKGVEATARAGALERLKALRGGSRRSENGGAGYSIKMVDPIYDSVPEDEYEELVARRREEAHGFIVDDGDGVDLGYGDEGQEEDWSLAGLPPSSGEDSDGELNIRKRRRAEKKEKETEPVKKVNAALTAAAAMMGKQSISKMFTSTVFKTKDSARVKSVDCESIVDDVIAEFAPDENDRERRRKAQLSSKPLFVPKKNENHAVRHISLLENATNGGNNEADRDDEDIQEENGNSLSEMKEEVELAGTSDDPMTEDAAVEVKVESSVEVKKEKGGEKGRVLNAKIGVVEREGLMSARSVWEEMRSVGDGGLKEEAKSEGKPEFEICEDGSAQFYIIDAYEEVVGLTIPKLYLFGKVKAGNTYHSCCVIVKNMQRCVFAIPNSSIFCTDEVIRLEKDAEKSRISPTEFHKKLQDVSYELKNEIATQLVNQNVSSFSMAPVKRKYAFERSDIPTGENYVLKINYPFEKAPLPSDLKGETFCALLGTHSSALELFLVKRRIKGPSWLSISRFSTCPTSRRTSWCKFEIIVDNPKDISVSSKKTTEIPPVIVSAISLKTVVNEKQNVEIVSASIICCHKAKVDTPMLAAEWKKPGMLSHFSVIRQFGREIYPMGFLTEAADINTKAGSSVLCVIKHRDCNERALLIRLMTELHKLDSDVLVGHNISGFDLDVLLRRAKACGVPGNMWSKIGRLNRDVMPNFTKRSSMFGSGASPGMMSCIAGRLLCDTYLCSRDLLKEVSYSLTQLAKSRLNKDRKEIGPHDIPAMFQASKSLIELVEYGETDAWLSMELMFHLSVLPLTRQLTNISGNLWGKSLQGARAQRVEYYLLHAFHAKKFIVPDKSSSYAKEVKVTKKRTNLGAVERDANQLDNDDIDFENEIPQNERGKGKKGPAYAGGLVLEPKKGFYDKYVLLLDFNSLYPSIIQEYNICFTTVERSSEDLVPRLPSSTTRGILPELLEDLVERRRKVKRWMKTASGLKLQQFDIQQQALKLIANSMYGCLGFSNSRFHAQPLAELITQQGREILQSTVDLVQNNLNLEVIYGDTDSIMIYSGLDDIEKAKEISGKVIKEVNKKYKCLEIDLDGLYKRMLLLKKKKYAAVKVQQMKDGTPYEVIERKGLDMVRRDWSLLSKEVGDFCLAQILSGGSCEDVVESIHNSLMKVQEDMRNGQVALEKYVITKTLTKQPETYPDAKNQPHVLVALRLKQSGYTVGCSAGDTVPYVICCEQGASSGSSTGIAQRARHPDELKQDDGNWMIDIEYYLAQQIHPVVSRLCASIEGTSPERLADCLGLDSSKFKSKSNEGGSSDPSSSLLYSFDDEERYQSCEPLILTCPSCSGTLNCPAVFSSICKSITEKLTKPQVEEAISNFWSVMRCLKCPNEGDTGRLTPAMIANQVKRQADGFVSTYYKGLMTCDDETCQHSTRRINLHVIGDSERGTVCPNYPRCNGHLIRKYTEADLYRQLSYFCYLLDTNRSMEKMEDVGVRISVERELSKVEPVVELAASTVRKIRDRCAYGRIRLSDLVITV